MSTNSASAGESTAAARGSYAERLAKAKEAAAKVETNDTCGQGDHSDDTIPTNALPTNPALNQSSAISAKDKGKMKSSNAIPTSSASAIPAKDKRKMKATSPDAFAAPFTPGENWTMKSTTSTTNTMTPQDSHAMAAHFMAKFRKNKERHRAISLPRQTTQYTVEEKYQHVIAGMLKRHGVESSVKTRTQVRRGGPTPNILSTEGGREIPELAQQLSDMLLADTAGIEKDGDVDKEARKEIEVDDADVRGMSNEEILDQELIKKGAFSHLRAVLGQIDKRISALHLQADIDIDLIASLSAQRGRISYELALLNVEDRARRAFLREDTTYDGRRGRLAMREGCAIPIIDPPVARSTGDIERCVFRRVEEGSEAETDGMKRPLGGSKAT